MDRNLIERAIERVEFLQRDAGMNDPLHIGAACIHGCYKLVMNNRVKDLAKEHRRALRDHRNILDVALDIGTTLNTMLEQRTERNARSLMIRQYTVQKLFAFDVDANGRLLNPIEIYDVADHYCSHAFDWSLGSWLKTKGWQRNVTQLKAGVTASWLALLSQYLKDLQPGDDAHDVLMSITDPVRQILQEL